MQKEIIVTKEMSDAGIKIAEILNSTPSLKQLFETYKDYEHLDVIKKYLEDEAVKIVDCIYIVMERERVKNVNK
jgi:predicted nucleic acid-binding protein